MRGQPLSVPLQRRPHHDVVIFESAPEVRDLSSASITRLRRSYDPVRFPPWRPPFRDVVAATLALDGSPPITRAAFPTCRAHYPGGSSGARVDCFPAHTAFPKMARGPASALSLLRPAQATLTLRPAGLLSRLKRPFITRLQPYRSPDRTARQLPDQSTTLWVESSFTSEPRLRGALPGTEPSRLRSPIVD